MRSCRSIDLASFEEELLRTGCHCCERMSLTSFCKVGSPHVASWISASAIATGTADVVRRTIPTFLWNIAFAQRSILEWEARYKDRRIHFSRL